jgi:hypothetical protein
MTQTPPPADPIQGEDDDRRFLVSTERALALGGVFFSLSEYEDPDDESNVTFRTPSLGLPADLVTGLVNLSWSYPDQKQAIFDALTPFQIMSKMWASHIVGESLSKTGQREVRAVLPGAWFGQQLSLLRRNARMRLIHPILIDMDARATEFSKSLLYTCDPFAVGDGLKEALFHTNDIFDPEFQKHEDWMGLPDDTLFVWNGLEHFDPVKAKELIVRWPNASFCLQSTNMEAEDHNFTCESIEDLLDYVPAGRKADIKYVGEIQADFGTRYMVMFNK